VLTENGVTNAVLGSRSGASKRLKKAAEEDGPPLPIFAAPSQLRPFITREMLDGPLKPIDYIDPYVQSPGFLLLIGAIMNPRWSARRL
jgi:hypothetical protein